MTDVKNRLLFTCEVPAGGFAWREGPFKALLSEKVYGALERALVAVHAEAPVHRFPPHPELYLQFGGLDPGSDDAIEAFAKDYGLLGGTSFRLGFSLPTDLSVSDTNKQQDPQTVSCAAVVGEPRSYWRAHINEMEEALWLWRAIKGGSTKLLAERFNHVPGSDHVRYKLPPISTRDPRFRASDVAITSPEFQQERLDMVLPARMHLQGIINTKLKEYVDYRLLFTAARKTTGMFCVPNSLIGCLWGQLALDVADFGILRNCAMCNKLIRVAPAGPRSNQTTCSPSCRTKLYLSRKSKVRPNAELAHPK